MKQQFFENHAWKAFCLVIGSLAFISMPNLSVGESRTAHFQASKDTPPPTINFPKTLPPVSKGAMQTVENSRGGTTLFFDDGTCESGLGSSTVTVQLLTNFDAPTSVGPSFPLIGFSARFNSMATGGSLGGFVLDQATASPPAVPDIQLPISPTLSTQGPCTSFGTPGNFQTRTISPASAVVTNSVGFFAGLQGDRIFVARDTSSPDVRQWFIGNSSSIYSPTFLTGYGLSGDYLIRVTVDPSSLPVELIGIEVE